MEATIEGFLLVGLHPAVALLATCNDIEVNGDACNVYPLRVGDELTPEAAKLHVLRQIHRRLATEASHFPPGTSLDRVTLSVPDAQTCALVRREIDALVVPIYDDKNATRRVAPTTILVVIAYAALVAGLLYYLSVVV